MSLESKIDALTQAVIALTAKLEANNVIAQPVTPQVTPTFTAAPIVAPAPVPAPAPAPVAVAMPAPPVFMAPAAPAPVASGAPFSDPKGLIDYVMDAFKNLGPRGQEIQKVLIALGYQNINDVKPEHYGALFSGVEALKG